MQLKQIAKIETGFSQKFGIPRQSSLVKSAAGRIIFEKPYRDREFIKGLEDFDYLWLIWGFSENKESNDATVRPPRLGGKTHMGVFATRSPFRPNNIGLSSLKIEEILYDEKKGPVIVVSGVDMLDGTPIYDIKPYVPYSDAHENARGGFSDSVTIDTVVDFDFELKKKLPKELVFPITEILKQDPRPAYDLDKKRDFKLAYGGFDITFTANENHLTVTGVEPVSKKKI